jgi:nitrite reductase (NADH) small subunit
MANFIKLTTEAELPPIDEAKEFSCRGRTFCVANASGVFNAMDSVCPHRGGPLGQGMIESGKVVCPWHGWAWDTKTGQGVQDPRMKVLVYPLKIEGGDVLIEI